MFFPVILCGGNGTRLWPLSRSAYPKQFVDFGDGQTLFKMTIKRAMQFDLEKMLHRPLIVTSETHRFYAQENLKECNQEATIIIEPVARNTAPAIAIAALVALKQDQDAILMVLPSDHMIDAENNFDRKLKEAIHVAESGYLVTFGIEPTGPDTGFGYIKVANPINDHAYKVDKFIEKPEKNKAMEMLSEGGYSWNSGIFVFKATLFLEELKLHAEDIFNQSLKAFEAAEIYNEEIKLPKEEFSLVPAISVDYAVMEKTQKAAVVPLHINWTDLGSWDAFYKNERKDQNRNVIKGDVLAVDTKGCYLQSRERLVATIGIEDIAVVETRDSVLVVPLSKSQDVRKIVEILKSSKRSEVLIHHQVYRPWGSYEILASGERFQVKRIIVQPGEQLSLQMHYHRAEHWIVVQGSAEITIGEKNIFLTENQSTYISVGEVHRLKNPGKIPLVVIEVQSGSYLREDDIVRISDKYNRV